MISEYEGTVTCRNGHKKSSSGSSSCSSDSFVSTVKSMSRSTYIEPLLKVICCCPLTLLHMCKYCCSCLRNPVVILVIFLALYLSLVTLAIVLSTKNPSYGRRRLRHTVIKTPREYYWRDEVWKSNNTVERDQQQISYGSQNYEYPLLVDMVELVRRLKLGLPVHVKPLHRGVKWIQPAGDRCVEDRQVDDDNDDDDINKTTSEQVNLLIIIRSQPENIQERKALRETWANESCYTNTEKNSDNELKVRRVFITGEITGNYNKTERIKRELQKEWDVHQDVAVAKFPDCSSNPMQRTMKLVAAMNWFREHCSQAEYLLMVDDDYFIHPGRFSAVIENTSPSMKSRLVAGYAVQDEVVIRNRRHKNFVSFKEYWREYFPRYLGSSVALMSRTMATDICLAMPFTKLLRLDEIFLGIVMYKLLIMPLHRIDFYSRPLRKPIQRVVPGHRQYGNMILGYGYGVEQLYSAWKHKNTNKGHCAKYVHSLNQNITDQLVKVVN